MRQLPVFDFHKNRLDANHARFFRVNDQYEQTCVGARSIF
jgi:hypothetical protein